jgi:hypothetical protein
MNLADMFVEAPQQAAPPVAQRSFMGYANQKQNNPANWVTLDNSRATRNLPIAEALQKNLQAAIAQVYGDGYRAQVYSGGQPALGSGGRRVGSTRHDGGNAADLYVLDPQGNRVTGDKLAGLGRHWLTNRLGGVGLEMRGGGIHLDTHADRAPVWTYGPVSPAQAALVKEFGGRAPQIAQTGISPLGQRGGSVPMMARGGSPQPVTPGFQMAPQGGPSPAAMASLAQMYQMQQADDQARQQREAEEEAVAARRRALFGGPSPFG